MEIRFELEDSDDIVIEFDSSFLYEYFSDRTEVQWKFHNGTHTRIVANVFDCASTSESRPYDLLPTLRLRCGYNEDIR